MRVEPSWIYMRVSEVEGLKIKGYVAEEGLKINIHLQHTKINIL